MAICQNNIQNTTDAFGLKNNQINQIEKLMIDLSKESYNASSDEFWYHLWPETACILPTIRISSDYKVMDITVQENILYVATWIYEDMDWGIGLDTTNVRTYDLSNNSKTVNEIQKLIKELAGKTRWSEKDKVIDYNIEKGNVLGHSLS